jgi:tetratricopeptide (TPR) repeat protein
LYAEGRIDDFRRRLDSTDAAAAPPALRSWANFRRADLAARAGRLDEMRRLRDRALTIDSLRGVPPNRLADEAVYARVDIVAGDARAAERLDSIARTPTGSRADASGLQFASALAMAGRPDRARATLKSYDASVTDTALRRVLEPTYHATLGEVLLAEHKTSEAIAEFRRADALPDGPANECTICLPWNLARAFDAANQPDSAIAMYERYLRTPFYARFGAQFDGSALAFVHRRLGELYDAHGNYTKAGEHYRAFVELWKDADPALQPRVAAVRDRLRKLPSEPAKP